MCDKTKIGLVRDGVDPVVLQKIHSQLVERFGEEAIEFIEPEGEFSYGKNPLDIFCPTPQTIVGRLIQAATHQPFRIKYADRIKRQRREWPRIGGPMFQWNRKNKWAFRYYDTPRKHSSSRSLLRQSRELSLLSVPSYQSHTVCSLEGLDLSRWP